MGRQGAASSNRRIRFYAGIAALWAGSLCLAAPAARAAAYSCDPLLDTMDKVYATNAHISTTGTVPGQATPYRSETIYAKGVAYSTVQGKWERSQMTLADLKERDAELRKGKEAVCKWLRDETLDGQPAAVYSEEAGGGDYKIDLKIWISKSSGLPLKQESDNPTRHTHSTTLYSYVNVTAPAGVQ